MAKDKEFESRMQGMRYAYDIVKKDGVEGLSKEINRRGITKIPFTTSQKEIDNIWQELATNMYVNTVTTFMYVLKNEFNFGKEEIAELKEKYDDAVKCTFDVDYMGEHYIKLEDYAVELNEDCGLNLDVNRIASCQDHFDDNNKMSNYHTVKVDRIIRELIENGHKEAAAFLEKKLG